MLTRSIVLLVILCVASSTCQAQKSAVAPQSAEQAASAKTRASTSVSPAEASFRKAMAIDGMQRVQYSATDGRSLTFAQFMAIVQAGHSFSKTVNSKESLAVLTISNRLIDSKTGSETSSRLNLHVGDRVPPIAQRDLGGHLHVLANGKKYTLLSFFFDGCVPCIQEAPALSTLAEHAKNLDVVSVTFDNNAKASQFAKQRGLTTSIIPNAQKYIDGIGVKVYPTLILVAPDGRLVGSRISYKTSAGHTSALANLKQWLGSLGLKT